MFRIELFNNDNLFLRVYQLDNFTLLYGTTVNKTGYL